MWASRMSRRNHLGMWRGYQWPQIPHLKRGRSFTVFPLPALPLFGSLQFTFLREWMVFDYVLLQCIPYVMATVLENAELCDTVSQCANLRVRCMSLSDHYTCLYHNCTSEYVGIWVCGRAWRGSSGRIRGRQGVGTDQWLHHRSYSRRRSWSECGVDSLKVFALGSKPREVWKNISEHNTVNQHRSLVFLLFNNLVHHLYHEHRTEIIIVFWVFIIT